MSNEHTHVAVPMKAFDYLMQQSIPAHIVANFVAIAIENGGNRAVTLTEPAPPDKVE